MNVGRYIHSSDEDISSDDEIYRVRRKRSGKRKNSIRKLDRLLGSEDKRRERADRDEDRLVKSAVWGALHDLPAHKQMLTPWFILITLLTVLQMPRMNYYIATIRSQYDYVLGSEALAVAINRFFDIALPIGRAVCTPAIGLFLNNLSVPMAGP
ncbi:hypothetical protein BKA61DRAFT_694142 [Leptodontidium sp. MPI-SDFR-AT-0119]|nr:hypothetical protein BKA61DRAFT_694142 [Leptodontidium sp. MPI-SDFR-AT-0119]